MINKDKNTKKKGMVKGIVYVIAAILICTGAFMVLHNVSVNADDGLSLEIESPDGGEVWSGIQLITWGYHNGVIPILPPGISILYQKQGEEWQILEEDIGGLDNDNYSWDTRTVPNGDYKVKVELWLDENLDGVCYEDLLYSTDSSNDWFTIQNTEDTDVNVTPAETIVYMGDSFSINITVNPGEPIAGAQFEISFDETLLMVDSVTEGDLFSGYDTFFNPGTIDNTNGMITGAFSVITTKGGSVSSQGTLATIHFTTKGTDGVSPLNLVNVVMGDPDANPVPLSIHNGSVTIQIYDTEPPASSVNLFTHYGYHLKETPLDITVDAFDDDSGVRKVSLYYRYSEDNVTWSDWMLYGENETISPYMWQFTAPNGTGYYEFHSIAQDNVDNLEAEPAGADSMCRIYPDWDVNMDQIINVLDIIKIGQQWDETGTPCWIPEDINCDGVINILDIILVAQHWTG